MSLTLDLLPYRLPLSRPWRSAHGLLLERRGWLVGASADGRTGYGDCAPLPAAGTEPQAAAARRLAWWRVRARGADPDALLAGLAAAIDDRRPVTPAADGAVETALLDLAARTAGRPLRDWLAADAAERIAVNAAPGAALDLTAATLADLVAAGWRVIKLKVGLADPATEGEALRRLAAQLPPGLQLRLDANGAWTEPDAARLLDGIAGLPIESCEEPLRDPDDEALARLQARVPFPLALDESLPRRPWPLDPAALPVRRLVLKPAVHGGPRATLALARRARAAGRELVLTSLIESAAGLWATAQLAAACGGGLAHGLATAHWLGRDLGAAPPIRAGEIALPADPGSGFRIANRV